MSGATSRQPALVAPLVPRLILGQLDGGLETYRCDLPLWLDIGGGRTSVAVSFRVDSGCELSMVGIDAAQDLGLPVPPDGTREYPLGTVTATKSEDVRCRLVHLRVWWTRDQVGEPFVWPVLFLTAPAHRRRQRALLGLGGVVTTCRWTVSGPGTGGSGTGGILFEDVRPI